MIGTSIIIKIRVVSSPGYKENWHLVCFLNVVLVSVSTNQQCNWVNINENV